MKTREELYALKEKIETLDKKLAELTEEEQEQVSSDKISNEYPMPHVSPETYCRSVCGLKAESFPVPEICPGCS